MIESVIVAAAQSGEVTVTDTHETTRSVVAQLEGQVLFAKLYNNPSQLSSLSAHCLALLGALASPLPASA